MRLSLKINKDFLNNRQILILDKSEIEEYYTKIGYGVEGDIYNYSNRFALKIFSDKFYNKKVKLNRKFKKVDALTEIKDNSFCFPIDLVVDSKLNKIGYYMELLAKKREDIYDFTDLKNDYKVATDKQAIFKILLDADRAIERIHRKGIIIGDIHPENIIIDNNGNPRFIDTDNYIYKDYDFDVQPWRTEIYEKSYGIIENQKDNDIFLYAMQVMDVITGLEPLYQYIDVKEHFDNILNKLNVDKKTIEGLRYIFSDAVNKPYISEVISDIDPNQYIFPNQSIYYKKRKK